MDNRLSQFVSRLIQACLWVARRYDYYINHSVLRLHSSPNYYQDPYQVYGQLRARDHILRSVANQGWLILGFNEVKDLLLDPRVGSDVRCNRFITSMVRFASGNIQLPLIDHPTMLNLNPPDHTRLRKLVTQGFTHKYTQSLAPKIEQMIYELLTKVSESAQSFDLISALAKPLPTIVIAEMLGVPQQDRHYIEAWSEKLIGVTALRNPLLIHASAKANQAMREYLTTIVEAKRQAPGQDLISQLIAVEAESGDKLTLDELLSTCVLILTAGHETTTRLIGNCIYHLLQNPAQLAAVRADKTLIDRAIEETLRHESPVQFTIRFVLEPFRYQDFDLKQNQLLLLGIGSGNRDPMANINPDVFNIHRQEINHMSFGHGIHLCLGMSLARLEARLAIKQLLNRYPVLRYGDAKPKWSTNDFFRGLTAMTLLTQETQ